MRSATNDDVLLFLSVERTRFAARGRQGGKDGATGTIRLGENGDALPGKGEVRIPAGETLIFDTPGGGGLGDPGEREKAAVQKDLNDGLISIETARRHYNWERAK